MCAVLVLLVGLAGGGHLLSRLDRARAEAKQAIAEVHQVRAELALHEVVHRDLKPANVIDPRCKLALRRTEALRSALLALVRTGTVSMPNDPGPAWVTWGFE